MSEALTDYELHQMYDEMLDEVGGDVTIAGHTYATSYAFKEVDPTAYRCGFADWLDNELSDGRLYEWADGSYHDEEEETEDEE